MIAVLLNTSSSFGTTQGLNQIATPDVQPQGTLALSFYLEDRKIGNPYQVQAGMGLTKWLEIDIFQGFKPNDSVIETEIGLFSKEPYLFSIGFLNWSPHSNVDPQPFAVAGYYYGRHQFVAGATHADFRNEALLDTPMISMRLGAFKSIGKAVPAIRQPSELYGTSLVIFRPVQRFLLPTIARTKCLVTSLSRTRFISGIAKNKAVRFLS